MKKTIPLDSRKAGALVLVLTLGLAAEVANADFTFGDVYKRQERLGKPSHDPLLTPPVNRTRALQLSSLVGRVASHRSPSLKYNDRPSADMFG